MSATAREEIVDKRGKVTSPVRQYFGYFKSDSCQTCCLQTMQGHRHYQDWQYDKFILPPQLLSSVGVQQLQTAKAIDICRYRWNTTQAATDHHGEAAVPYNKTSKRYEEIMDAVAYHLAKDFLLLRTVQKSGYKNLVQVLDPRDILISNRLKK